MDLSLIVIALVVLGAVLLLPKAPDHSDVDALAKRKARELTGRDA